ncbi:MAG: hypothetical protein NSGCLCUN01_03966 [uncultured Clostridium sp.]
MREERKESIEEVEGIHKCLETTKEEILNKRKAAAKIMFKMLKVDCRNYREVKERISQLIKKERWENSEYDIPYSILTEVSKLLIEEMFSLPCNAKSELKNEERLTKEQRDLLDDIETEILEEIILTLSWRCAKNNKSALRYEKITETILIDEDKLMKVIQLISPTQKKRNIKVVKGLMS